MCRSQGHDTPLSLSMAASAGASDGGSERQAQASGAGLDCSLWRCSSLELMREGGMRAGRECTRRLLLTPPSSSRPNAAGGHSKLPAVLLV